MDCYIENGVRRAVAAREAGLGHIPAILHQAGTPPSLILISLQELYSPKRSISRSDPRYVRALQGMSTQQGRAKMPPIEVEPLGAPGQTPAIPLSQVALDP